MNIVDFEIENGILIANMSKGLVVDVHHAQKMVDDRILFQNGIEYPVLIRVNGIKFASSKASSFMQKEGLKGLKAGAFIISNPVEKIILNFLIMIHRPAIPSKMFTNEKEALKWLQQYK